jgi:hypothetical protein
MNAVRRHFGAVHCIVVIMEGYLFAIRGRRLRTRVRQQQASISGGSRTRSSEAKQDKVDGIRAQLMKVNIEF